MTEEEMKLNDSIRKMLVTHDINIVFTPKQSVVGNENTNAPATGITEERVIELIREHTATASDALKESIEEAIEEKFSDYDFSDAVSDAVDDALNNKDWDYELREAVDLDKLAERVAEKLDWETIAEDNNFITGDSVDVDDIMLKSEELNEDEIVKHADLADRVSSELNRDWFKDMLNEKIRDYVLEKQLPTLVAKAIHNLFVNASQMAVETKKSNETSDIQQRQDG